VTLKEAPRNVAMATDSQTNNLESDKSSVGDDEYQSAPEVTVITCKESKSCLQLERVDVLD
jgi:hypothetical protein